MVQCTGAGDRYSDADTDHNVGTSGGLGTVSAMPSIRRITTRAVQQTSIWNIHS